MLFINCLFVVLSEVQDLQKFVESVVQTVDSGFAKVTEFFQRIARIDAQMKQLQQKIYLIIYKVSESNENMNSRAYQTVGRFFTFLAYKFMGATCDVIDSILHLVDVPSGIASIIRFVGVLIYFYGGVPLLNKFVLAPNIFFWSCQFDHSGYCLLLCA
ncbi:MAG: hypothetical protein MI923_00265 [Phycisphaerales bacterium]|nr:hypothetical protein [Phycisphaerales bacterium]